MTTPPSRTTGARRAFTLTELLVVVVIIVILISILLPAVGGARNTARRASTESLMSSIHAAIGQFRAAEQRMPGYFTVQEVGANANWIRKPDEAGIRGFTYLENASLDLAGGVYDDQGTDAPDTNNDPDAAPDVIRVGVGQADKEVNVRRTAVGAKDGPGYLDMPEGFVDMGSFGDGRAGTWLGHKWMPRLVDSWGVPILMWPRDEFSKRKEPLVQGLYDGRPNNTSAPFYWAGNSGFLNAPRLGLRTQKSQWNDSTLSSNGRNPQGATGPLPQTLAAVVGHPAFPDPTTLEDAPRGPEPAQARGDVILQSAGPDGIYLESKGGKFDQYHYIPDGLDFSSTPSWLAEDVNYLENTDDIISSGS